MSQIVRIVLLTTVLLALSGCQWLNRLTNKEDSRQREYADLRSANVSELVGQLNRQADALNTVRYPEMTIEIDHRGDRNTLGDSWLVAAKPNNLFLSGGKGITGELVRVGSNADEFWMVSKGFAQIEPLYLYCSHQNLPRAAHKLPIPFDPNWALVALGMQTYDPNPSLYRVDTDTKARQHRLIMQSTGPQGQAVERVTVFAADPPTGNRPTVRSHLILDTQRNVIARADIKEVTRSNGIEVPTRVSLEWPQQHFRMDLKMPRPMLNEQLTDSERNKYFQKPEPQNARPVNLALVGSNANRQYRGAMPADRPASRNKQ